MIFSDDILEFLYLLNKHNVKYMIVGGEAVIYYGYARLTGDIDIYYDLSKENCTKLFSCLNEFWDNDIPGLNQTEELERDGIIIQFGLPPNRIDLINNIDGVNFNEAWTNKESLNIEDKSLSFVINYIGIDDLIKNKKYSGRNKDMDDLDYLTRRTGRKFRP